MEIRVCSTTFACHVPYSEAAPNCQQTLLIFHPSNPPRAVHQLWKESLSEKLEFNKSTGEIT